MLSHLKEDLRIAGAIINCFYKRLMTSEENALAMASKMKRRLNKQNKLASIVKRNHLSNMTYFYKVTAENELYFPRLSIDELENNITFGEYQIDQGRGYIQERLKSGGLDIFIAKAEFDKGRKLVCCKFNSRHKNETNYWVYVQYLPSNFSESSQLADLADLSDASDSSPVMSSIDWFCTCLDGSRTVGGCSHVTALIYHLAVEKQKSKQNPRDYKQFIKSSKSKNISEISSKLL